MNLESGCSDDRLRTILSVDEDSEAYMLAARHVDRCSECQHRIGELAAGDDDWIETRELLSSDFGGDDTDYSLRPWSNQSWHSRRPDAWTDSMASQLLSAPSHPEMLGRIGRYEVERLIGAGGMGVVFKAFDTELNRPVAIKVLAPYLAGSGAARKRFSREARAAAAVVHEHVVAIHNVEPGDDPLHDDARPVAPFLVMQHVAGESLQQRIDRVGPLELCEILRIGMQTASGLSAAHQQGLVHRDVKPANILLEQGIERALLTDFGLARASDDASLTHSGFHPGTPQYMSPEQARGELIDARSDLFSLGSVLYTMCTGRPPFRSETSYAILRRIVETEPRTIREINPSIPDWLERLVCKLLAKSPDSRFESAQQVADLLRQCLAHVQQPTSVQLPSECRDIKLTVRAWFAARSWIAASLAIGMLAVAAFAMTQWSPAEKGSENADSVPLASDTLRSDPDPQNSLIEPESTAPWNAAGDQIESLNQDLSEFQFRLEQSWDSSSLAD